MLLLSHFPLIAIAKKEEVPQFTPDFSLLLEMHKYSHVFLGQIVFNLLE